MLKTELLWSLILSILILFFPGDMSASEENTVSRNVELTHNTSKNNNLSLTHYVTKTSQQTKQPQNNNSFFSKANPTVDFFAGLAAILGIIYPLGIWIYGRKPPLKIKSVTVFANNTNGNASYAFIYENRKNHPVTVYETNIYTDKFYLITESVEHSVTFSGPGFSDAQRVLSNKTTTEVSAHGSQPITMSGGEITKSEKLFIQLHTTNGYQTIKCNKIEHVDVGEVELHHNMYDISCFVKAKFVYYGLKFPWLRSKKWVKKYAEQWLWGKTNKK